MQDPGRVAHNDENGILPDIHEVVVVRSYQCVLEKLSSGNVGTHLELAGDLKGAAQNAAGTGNIVGQAAGLVGIARGAVENFGAEVNPVVPGHASAAEIVASFEFEPDDCAAGVIFVQWPWGEGFRHLDMRGIALLGHRRTGRQCQQQDSR